jgi:hypothetical protein
MLNYSQYYVDTVVSEGINISPNLLDVAAVG